MLFNVSCDVTYKVNFPSTLTLSVHAQRNVSQTVVDEQFSVEPKVKFSDFTTEGTDIRFVRIETRDAKMPSITLLARAWNCGLPPADGAQAGSDAGSGARRDRRALPVPEPLLRVRRLSRLAWDLFGKIRIRTRRCWRSPTG